MTSKKTAVLFLNLGTPQGADPQNVGRYLKEFLMDKYVLDIPAPLRWFLVNVLIVPKRKYASAEAYEKIWTQRGSPLLFLTKDLAEHAQQELGPQYDVRFVMRYGQPSIEKVLSEWDLQHCEKLILFPLYPQYAESTTRSCTEKFEEVCRKLGLKIPVEIVKDFYDHPAFIEAFAQTAEQNLKGKVFDKILFSFHGLPLRHLQKLKTGGGAVCEESNSCCAQVTERNRNCYRAQSFATARALAAKMGLQPSQWMVGFQSRLGRAKWIEPFTDQLIERLPSQGVKRLAIMCPSFVTDCLETTEEIGMRARESFLAAGGQEFYFIPTQANAAFPKIIESLK